MADFADAGENVAIYNSITTKDNFDLLSGYDPVIIDDNDNNTHPLDSKNDRIGGLLGKDNYFYSGDSNNILDNPFNVGKALHNIIFGVRINQNDVTFSRPGNDVGIGLSGFIDSITVKNCYVATDSSIKPIQFSDGISFTNVEIEQLTDKILLLGTDIGETLLEDDLVDIGADTIDGGAISEDVDPINLAESVIEEIIEDINPVITAEPAIEEIIEDVDPVNPVEQVIEEIIEDINPVIPEIICIDESDLADDKIIDVPDKDTIIGKAGNDKIKGSKGSDTYLFNKGDGKDTLTDKFKTLDATDRVIFGKGINKKDIALFMKSGKLTVRYGAGDELTVTSQNDKGKGIEVFQLNDGQFLTSKDVELIVQDMTGYAKCNDVKLKNIDNVTSNQDLMNIVINAWHS